MLSEQRGAGGRSRGSSSWQEKESSRLTFHDSRITIAFEVIYTADLMKFAYIKDHSGSPPAQS
jgi:hypothetical protein